AYRVRLGNRLLSKTCRAPRASWPTSPSRALHPTATRSSSPTHREWPSISFSFKQLPYDPTRDFMPVALVCNLGPQMLSVNGTLPVSTVSELIAYPNPIEVSSRSASTIPLAPPRLPQSYSTSGPTSA